MAVLTVFQSQTSVAFSSSPCSKPMRSKFALALATLVFMSLTAACTANTSNKAARPISSSHTPARSQDISDLKWLVTTGLPNTSLASESMALAFQSILDRQPASVLADRCRTALTTAERALKAPAPHDHQLAQTYDGTLDNMKTLMSMCRDNGTVFTTLDGKSKAAQLIKQGKGEAERFAARARQIAARS